MIRLQFKHACVETFPTSAATKVTTRGLRGLSNRPAFIFIVFIFKKRKIDSTSDGSAEEKELRTLETFKQMKH